MWDVKGFDRNRRYYRNPFLTDFFLATKRAPPTHPMRNISNAISEEPCLPFKDIDIRTTSREFLGIRFDS